VSRSEQLIATADFIEALENSLDLAETPEERSELEQRITDLVSQQYRDADALITVIHRWESRQKEAEDLKRRIDERASVYGNRASRMRDRLAQIMSMYDVKKAEGLTGVITLRPGSESVIIDGEIPPEYCDVVPAQARPDKARIKRALKSGADVPGARLARGAPVIQIR
jgi:hypothetical protein